MLFENLDLIEPVLRALKTEGYETPTPIQEQAIPIILQRKDLLGCAQTGTGKTAAFAIPIIQILYDTHIPAKGKRRIKSLIVTPTRELAIQIGESFAAYGRYAGLKHTVIYGGVGERPQTDALRQGIDILIATPGRLLDLLNQGYIDFRNIELFVLDEADRMLDMGFIHDVKRIIAELPHERQSLFFSATMPSDIVKLSQTILKNPVKVEVTPEITTAEKVEQQMYMVNYADKRSLLLHLLRNQKIVSALVFTRTKHGADKVVQYLQKNGHHAQAIHGNKSQNARQKALSDFKGGKIRLLVATDIAARGIDIDDLTHVINFEIPNIPETYIHRIGRTGRAGQSGIALSFCDNTEIIFLRDIQRLISQTIPVVDDHPYLLTDFTPVKAPAKVSRKPVARQHNGQAVREISGNREVKPYNHPSSHLEPKPKRTFWSRRP
ncbi:MAG: DEAD/DEAH box helicase [Bacteroidota bacterium]|nr:DEAD/DEAH box helicase [Odoribacter sp.]MDP3644185.1 DEAD/DEAH box helicase [Bacteroidota bacterium]